MRILFHGKVNLIIMLVILSRFTPASGCSTPVFRYALERWPAYLYQVEVLHNGTFNIEQQRALDFLKSFSGEVPTANILVVEKLIEETMQKSHNMVLPVIRISYPKEQKGSDVFWEGPLNEANVRRLVHSPARSNATYKIQQGDAVVWFYLDGGDKTQDDLQANLLQEQLVSLSKELKLAATATDITGKPLEIDTLNRRVHFSMVRVSRTDPDEEIFIKMLLGTEADLASFNNPLAFPVFGRGRALYALVGKGINPKLIRRACNSIIGWCSCTVKEDNPGVDLLFNADWEKAVGDSSWIQTEALPEITGLTKFLPEEVIVEKEIEATDPQDREIIEPLNEATAPVTNPARPSVEVSTEAEKTTPVLKESRDVESKDQLKLINKIELGPTESEKITPGPLLRNILIFIGLFIVVVPLVSIFWRKGVKR